MGQSSEFLKAQRVRRREAGLCTICGKRPPRSPKHTICDYCVEYGKKRYKKQKEAGLCLKCRRRKPARGHKRCKKCTALRIADRAARLAAGLCVACGNRKPRKGRVLCGRCTSYYTSARSRAISKGLCTKCKHRVPTPGWKQCEHCLARAREYNRKLREAVFAAYGGPICRCCGEANEVFLQLDHLHNDGCVQRRKLGRGNQHTVGNRIYAWAKRNGFPPGFQVLCANCNFAKSLLGYCPHQPATEVTGVQRKGRKKRQGPHAA
jgi:hypothetical protein